MVVLACCTFQVAEQLMYVCCTLVNWLCLYCVVQVAKSGAGWIVQLLLLVCGSITAALPAMAVLYLVANLAWLKSTMRLCKDMKHYEQHQAAAKKAAVRRQQQEQQQHPETQQQQLKQVQILQQQLVAWQSSWELWQQQQQQQHLLPLPGELALAATTVYASRVQAQNGNGGISTPQTSTTRSTMNGSSQQQQQQQQQIVTLFDSSEQDMLSQPLMLQDAVYWDAIYAALSADAGLMESVLLGRKAAAAYTHHHLPQRKQQQSQESAASIVKPAPAEDARGSVQLKQQAAQPLPGAVRRMPVSATQQQQLDGSRAAPGQREGVPELRGVALAKEALHTMFDA